MRSRWKAMSASARAEGAYEPDGDQVSPVESIPPTANRPA